MREFGWLLVVMGGVLIATGFLWPTSVSVPGSALMPSTSVINFGQALLAAKLLMAGGFALVAGAVFVTAGWKPGDQLLPMDHRA